MEQKFWEVALILALLKITVNFFHGEMDKDGTLKGHSSIKLSTKLHSPMGVSGDSFPHDTPRSPLSPVTVLPV